MNETIEGLIKYVRTRLWLQNQWPDPEMVYRHGGMLALASLLRQTSSPTVTKDVLTKFGAKIHPDCWPIGPNLTLHEYGKDFSNLEIGPFVHIGKEVFFDLTEKVIVEESVGIGMRTIVLTHFILGDYPNKPLSRLYPKKRKPTVFRRGCSVGAGCVIASGVEIGEDSSINAGVLVDRDVPPRTIVHSSRQRKPVSLPERFFKKMAAEAQAKADGKG
ncbi:MAG: hypothetical protein AB1Z98_18635 [Nannocystaceae bacterium]